MISRICDDDFPYLWLVIALVDAQNLSLTPCFGVTGEVGDPAISELHWNRHMEFVSHLDEIGLYSIILTSG